MDEERSAVDAGGIGDAFATKIMTKRPDQPTPRDFVRRSQSKEWTANDMTALSRETVSDHAVAGVDLIQPLIALSKSTRQLVSLKLAETGVMAGQDQLLDALDLREQRSICTVANTLSVRPSTVSKMLDILERRGWCQREADDVDLRRTFVRLTAEGERIRQNVRRIWQEVNGDLMRQLPPDAVPAMSAALRQVEDLLVSRLARLR